MEIFPPKLKLRSNLTLKRWKSVKEVKPCTIWRRDLHFLWKLSYQHKNFPKCQKPSGENFKKSESQAGARWLPPDWGGGEISTCDGNLNTKTKTWQQPGPEAVEICEGNETMHDLDAKSSLAMEFVIPKPKFAKMLTIVLEKLWIGSQIFTYDDKTKISQKSFLETAKIVVGKLSRKWNHARFCGKTFTRHEKRRTKRKFSQNASNRPGKAAKAVKLSRRRQWQAEKPLLWLRQILIRAWTASETCGRSNNSLLTTS